MTAPEAWREEAKCKGSDPAIFYPEHYKNPVTLSVARSICAECPVSVDCLAAALNGYERHGIWGGLTPKERGAEQIRVCRWCDNAFRFEAKPGYPRVYCSDQCKDAARIVIRERSDITRVKNPGLMRTKGHGKISRYNAGCRCAACRKTARNKRRDHRVHGSYPQGTDGEIAV